MLEFVRSWLPIALVSGILLGLWALMNFTADAISYWYRSRHAVADRSGEDMQSNEEMESFPVSPSQSSSES